jgi:hypothetical protein
MEINDHLFRREAGRLVSALTRIFGIHKPFGSRTSHRGRQATALMSDPR